MLNLRRSALAVVGLLTSALFTGGVTTTASALPVAPFNDVYVLAHQDDDLIFANPDITESIAAGNTVSIIYMTSGLDTATDSTAYWLARLNGERAAYAQQAGVANTWTTTPCSATQIYAKTALANSKVTLYAFSLPNAVYNDSYGQSPTGLPWTKNITNTSVWNSGATTFTLNANPQLGSDVNYKDAAGTFDTTKSCAPNLTKDAVTNALATLVGTLAPQRYSTLDPSRLRYLNHAGTNFEHDDHVISALWGMAALEKYRAAGAALPDVRYYRTYNADNGSPTFDTTDPAYIAKCGYVTTYATFDSHFPTGPACSTTYQAMIVRNVKSGIYPTLPGVQLRNRSTGTCLTGTLGFASCGDSGRPAAQTWTLNAKGQLASGGQCLTKATTGAGVVLAACATTPGVDQIWTVTDYGQIRGSSARCVHPAPTSGLEVIECPLASTQNWTTPGNTLWQVVAGNARVVVPALSDASIGTTDATKYNSAVFAKLRPSSGTGQDICFRKADGLWCVTNDGAGTYSTTPVLASSVFSDANGWNVAQFQRTIQFADVNGDGLGDLCAEKANAVTCYLNQSTSTTIAFATTATTVLSGLGGDAALLTNDNYRTIKFADVTGDGKPDLCYRSSAGLNCAPNTSTTSVSFGAVQLLSSVGIADASGWANAAYAGTVMYGDLDGNGKADVCMRGSAGVWCALSTSSGTTVSFAPKRLWTQLVQTSDASGWNASADLYRNLRLIDADGNGRVDLCVRDGSGINCASSTGTGFGPLTPLTTSTFTAAAGWSVAPYVQTLVGGLVDDPNARQLCMRGSAGLTCSGGASTIPAGGGGGGGGGGGTTTVDHTAGTFTGTWTNVTEAGNYGGSAKQCAVTTCSVTYTFTGTGVSWLGQKDANFGKASVYIDNVLVATADAYSATNLYQQTLYAVSGLSSGSHTIKIVPTATHSASSTGNWIEVDAFTVTT